MNFIENFTAVAEDGTMRPKYTDQLVRGTIVRVAPSALNGLFLFCNMISSHFVSFVLYTRTPKSAPYSYPQRLALIFVPASLLTLPSPFSSFSFSQQLIANRSSQVFKIALDDLYEFDEQLGSSFQQNGKRYLSLVAKAADRCMPEPTEDIEHLLGDDPVECILRSLRDTRAAKEGEVSRALHSPFSEHTRPIPTTATFFPLAHTPLYYYCLQSHTI